MDCSDLGRVGRRLWRFRLPLIGDVDGSTVSVSLPPVAKPGTPRLLSRCIGFGTLAAAAEAQPPTAPRPHAELDRHPLHLPRRLAALRAPLPRARLAAAARRVPGGPHPQLARLPRPRHRARPPRRDRPRRLLPRLSRPRPLPARSRLEELLGPRRAQRRARFHGHEGAGPRRRRRHLARRADRHADGRAPSRRHGRRGPQRHRSRSSSARVWPASSPTSGACRCPPTGKRRPSSPTR